MAKLPASLFNDVIGPVMRGPSSSHVAGAARIGTLGPPVPRRGCPQRPRRIRRQRLAGRILPRARLGHRIRQRAPRHRPGPIPASPMPAPSPSAKASRWPSPSSTTGPPTPTTTASPRPAATGAPSIGKPSPWAAAMVEMQRFEGFPVSIDGGYHEYLLLIDAHAAPLEQAAASVKAVASSDELRAESDGARLLINLKRASALDAETVARLRALPAWPGASRSIPSCPRAHGGAAPSPSPTPPGSLNTPSRTAGRCGSLPPAMKACAATPPKRTFSTRWIGWSASWKRPSRTGLRDRVRRPHPRPAGAPDRRGTAGTGRSCPTTCSTTSPSTSPRSWK